jgi:hypothetical protein
MEQTLIPPTLSYDGLEEAVICNGLWQHGGHNEACITQMLLQPV